MKRASRLLPLLQPSSSRSSLLFRPSVLPLASSQAGPSDSLRFASSSAPRRLPSKQIQKNGPSSGQPVEEEFEEDEPEMNDEEMEMIRIEAEEDVASSLAQQNGSYIYRKPTDGLPIILPLSSLATDNPTEPGPEGLAISLPTQIFGAQIRRDILHRCVIWYRSTMRQGTHKAKGRADVSYSGRKLRPQKGTGRARLADKSSPTLKGGGMAHYKRPRNYAQLLPRKVRAMGMRIALSLKLNMGLLRVTSNLNEGQWAKTSEAASTLYDTPALSEVYDTETNELVRAGREPVARFGEFKKMSVLFVHPPQKPVADVWEFARCVRNIPGVEVMSTDEVEVYHILKYKWLVLEGGAVDTLSRKKGMGHLQREMEVGEEASAEAMSENEGWEDVEEVNENEDVSSSIIQPTSETTEVLPAVIAESGDVSPAVIEENEPPHEEFSGDSVTPARIPKQYLVNRWRKIRGVKSMRRTFGTKNATTLQIRARREYNKLKSERVRLQKEFKRLKGEEKLDAVEKLKKLDRNETFNAVLAQMHKRHSEEFSVRTK